MTATPPEPQWTLANTIAKWSHNKFNLTFSRTTLENGLEVRASSLATRLTCRLFGLCLPNSEKLTWQPEDQASCCGNTLRVSLTASERFPIETNVAWNTSASKQGMPTVDAVVSVSTQLLCATPELTLRSTLNVKQVLVSTDGQKWSETEERTTHTIASGAAPSVLLRLPGDRVSYLEAIHPADVSSLQLLPDLEAGTTAICHGLFHDSLEKGVILRARLRGIFLPRENDTAAASECLARFAHEAPPLGR